MPPQINFSLIANSKKIKSSFLNSNIVYLNGSKFEEN